MKKAIEKLVSEMVDAAIEEEAIRPQQESPEELNVYDFDDSLVKTRGIIEILNNQTGEIREISATVFQTTSLEDHEEFILNDFNKLLDPEPLPLLDRMIEKYKQLGPNGVSICTARPEPDAVRDFMVQHGMGDIEIAALGDAAPRGDVARINASRKRKYLRNKILKRGLKILRFFDDNIDNCTAARTLQAEFPDVQIEIEQIVSTPSKPLNLADQAKQPK